MSGLASSRVRARERLPGLCAGRAWERFLREAGPWRLSWAWARMGVVTPENLPTKQGLFCQPQRDPESDFEEYASQE